MLSRLTSLFRRKPRTFHHPEFGQLTFESGIWEGKVAQKDQPIPFWLPGTEEQPDTDALETLRSLLGQLREVERTALSYIAAHESVMRPDEFQIYALDVHSPDLWAIEFLYRGDDTVVWRVEFKNGEPVSFKFDD